MTVLLVRHAHAGDRSRWAGDDRHRPLSAKGRGQAEALVDTLRDFPIDRIVSSPYRRCLESVEPLASSRGLAVEDHEELAEGAGPWEALRLARGDEHLVLCSHGDVIGEVVTTLLHAGVLHDEPRWPKGSTWVLEVADGAVNRARFLGPPR